MITDELVFTVSRRFGHAPTADQQRALETFAAFMFDRDEQVVMLLRGSAGTGKTSLASAVVRTLTTLKQKLVLMAPTGRAAKVFSLNSGCKAFTIHRRIYRERSYSGLYGSFVLNHNQSADTLFMVDEASMIATGQGGDSGGNFGSGSLLHDLISFVYSGRNCRLMLIGDKAQLPPVGETESRALSRQQLESMGLKVYECDLNEVVRQDSQSGILFNATMIRGLLDTLATDVSACLALPKIHFKLFADVRNVPGNELIEALNGSYTEVGVDETMVITRSNKRANIYNQGIRNTILDCEDRLSTGDMVMVVKNKYIDEPSQTSDEQRLSFLANGDRACVQRVRNVRELYGFHFADVTLRFPDYDQLEMEQTVILEVLTTEAPALSQEQNELLFQRVMEDYADVPLKRDRMAKLKQDDYFNALQIKFAYAVTCHKAQGGQWAHIYLDQGYMGENMLTPDYIHWLYTAVTRATEKLYLVNWPKEQTADPEED